MVELWSALHEADSALFLHLRRVAARHAADAADERAAARQERERQERERDGRPPLLGVRDEGHDEAGHAGHAGGRGAEGEGDGAAGRGARRTKRPPMEAAVVNAVLTTMVR